MNCHCVPSVASRSASLEFSADARERRLLSSASAPLNVVAWSLQSIAGMPRLATNRLKAARKAEVEQSLTTSRCMALVDIQTKRAMYPFSASLRGELLFLDIPDPIIPTPGKLPDRKGFQRAVKRESPGIDGESEYPACHPKAGVSLEKIPGLRSGGMERLELQIFFVESLRTE
ncbi:UNVERIFIED_CONTAM: hypothetical protein PYX00_006910 [Menopon gallinae]|uniref:Uncharacterized protein n=1 Tax=Menopon gallinae TaxID=328185 RepID=A0AAW2HGY0_9NEOP